jgi:hypothetical protein
MALTGELENLPIVDVIQLVHTTRKSGIFSVKSEKGESRIVFSGGYIVGANHINDTVRIGSVLVKMGAITVEDLKAALDALKGSEQDHAPLVATLIKMGKLRPEDALKGLKKLVEITIVELMGWTKGTFTFDTEAAVFSGDADAGSDEIAPDVVLDAQMVLMDALRIFDERERDRAVGKDVPSFEALYADVLPGQGPSGAPDAGAAITADLLGLADVDKLEKKIPRPVGEMEIFDPLAIHRQKVRELLAGFPPADQDAFVAFLKQSVGRKAPPDAAARQSGKAVVLFSNDMLLRHAVMTVCKEDGVPVFSTDGEADLDRIVMQCHSAMRMPVVVFDGPGETGSGLPEEAIMALRDRIRSRYPAVPLLQLAPPGANDLTLRSYSDGVWAVLPKPTPEGSKGTFVQETIQFLSAFKTYIKGFQYRPDAIDRYVKELKRDIKALREIATPSDAALVLLITVADMFERAATFIVRPSELAGERAIGVSAHKSEGPTHADRLKISLAKPSLFREVLEKAQVYYGASSDGTLQAFRQEIGKPLSPECILLPVISDRKVVAIVYGDFGQKETSPVQLDVLEVLAYQVGMSLEHALLKRQMAKVSQKA